MTTGSQGTGMPTAEAFAKAVVDALEKRLGDKATSLGDKLGVPRDKDGSRKLGIDLANNFMEGFDSVLGLGLQALFAKQIVDLSGQYYDKFVKPVEKANSELAKTFTTVASARARLAVGEPLSDMGMQASHLATQFEDLGQKILSNSGNLHDFDNSLRFVKKGMAGKIQIMDLGAKAAAALEGSLLPLTLANEKAGGTAAFNTEMLLKLQQAYKLSAEDLGKIGTRAVGMGKTVSSVLLSGEKAAKKYAKAFGLNANTVIKDIGKLMTDFETFGHRSSEELANVSAAARALGVSLDGVKKMQMYDDFDQAANAAAKASQYFGMMIDPMELFLANDEDRLKIIKERAELAGVDLEGTGPQARIMRKTFSKALGISMQDLVPLLSKQNMGAAKAEAGAAAVGKPMTLQEETQAVEKELRALTAAFKEGPEAFSKFTSGLADLIPKAEQTFMEQTKIPLQEALLGDIKTLQSFTKTLTDPTSGALSIIGSLSKALAHSDLPGKQEVMRNNIATLGDSLQKLQTTSEHLNNAIEKVASKAPDLDKATPEQLKDAYDAASVDIRKAGQTFMDFSETLSEGVRENIQKALKSIVALTDTSITSTGKAAQAAIESLKKISKSLGALFLGTALGTIDMKKFLGGALDQIDPDTADKLRKQGLISARPLDAPKVDTSTPQPGQQIPQGQMYAVAYSQELNDKLELITGMVEARQNIHLTINQQTSLDKATVLQAVLDAPVSPGGPTFRREFANKTGNTLDA